MSSSFRTGYALDASALLAVMLNESGHEKVREVIDRAFIHSVNVAEVIGKLMREGVPRTEAEQMIEELNLDIDQELSTDQAVFIGELLAKTRRQGLSLGDCVCLAMATWRGNVAVTADRRWQELHGHPTTDKGQIRILVIR
jgi:ribonuclease VapC